MRQSQVVSVFFSNSLLILHRRGPSRSPEAGEQVPRSRNANDTCHDYEDVDTGPVREEETQAAETLVASRRMRRGAPAKRGAVAFIYLYRGLLT